MMLTKRCFLLLLALLPVCSFAGERSVFQGMLEGAGMVVLELEVATQEEIKAAAEKSGTELEIPPEAKNLFTGRKCSARHGVDVPLFGTLESLAEPQPLPLPLSERDGWRSPKAYWKGRIVQGHFRGQWADAATGRARRFDLKRVARYDPDKTHPDSTEAIAAYIQQAPYEYLKLQGYAVPVGAIIPGQTETVAWQAFRDPRSELSYPRLVRHPNPDIMKRINALLEERHWQMTLAALGCASTIYTDDKSPAAGSLGGYDDMGISVDFLSRLLTAPRNTHG
jgi:hypothetical protein